jgi:hypothetical protein
MFSSKLSSPIDISHLIQYDEIDNYLYHQFKSEFMDPDKREKLHGKFIHLDCKHWINNKNDVFWHLISLDKKEKFNILPCNNCSSFQKCPLNCINPSREITLANGNQRNICYYRGIRIKWLNEIIVLANNGDPNIKTWKGIKKIPGKGNIKQYFIRFSHEAVDFILIFEEKYKNGLVNKYFFVTAFPIFYINSKQNYEAEYQSYQSSLMQTT